MIEYTANWRAAGACLSADPDLFFPIANGAPCARQEAEALWICAGCPVRQQCLDFAVRTGEADGIWGGTTAAERIRARRRKAHRRPATRPSWQEPGTRAS
jgi:WhiB family transcriptional regulator, redox-sensing transcriptional regulator